VVFDVDENVVGAGGVHEVEVVGEVFYGGFSDEDVDSAGDGVEGDGVVGCVWGEDCVGIAGGEGGDGGLVGERVVGVVEGVGGECAVEVVVGEGDVFLEVLACGFRSGERRRGGRTYGSLGTCDEMCLPC